MKYAEDISEKVSGKEGDGRWQIAPGNPCVLTDSATTRTIEEGRKNPAEWNGSTPLTQEERLGGRFPKMEYLS